MYSFDAIGGNKANKMLSSNAFVRRFEPPLRQCAGKNSGLLQGRSVAVKDNFDIAGFVTGAGSPVWKNTHDQAATNAYVLDRLLDSGACIVGKTQMDELAFSLMGINAHYGTPLNPAVPGRVPGGSSSGSATAVAGGLADIGIGTDTGGSVRIPASFCGLFGMRPTHGRIDTSGLLPLAPSFDTVGFFARDPETMIAAGTALGIETAIAKTHNIRLPTDLWSFADPASAEVLRSACDVLFADTDLSKNDPLAVGVEDWCAVFQTIQGYEIWTVFGEWIKQHNPAFGAGTRERFQMASRITRAEFEAAAVRRRTIRNIENKRRRWRNLSFWSCRRHLVQHPC